jgi:transposase
MLTQGPRERILWIDETHLCSKDYNPRYGYFEGGAKNVCVCPFTTNLSCTFIVCMSYTRVVAILYKDNREHGVNALDYLEFLRLIPNRYSQHILFQDNARLHHDSLIEDYLETNNITVINNAMYSSDYQAIESLFNVVKARIRQVSYLNQNNAKRLFVEICQSLSSRVINNIVDATYKRYENS